MQDNWNNRKVSLMNLNTPLYSSGGSPMAFSVFHSAFAIYGTVDYLGTGGNLVRFYNIGASTSERDFTEAELTDGTTYTNWLDGASTGLTRIAKLYNQLGDSDLDLTNASASNRPWYESSENAIRFDQAGYFAYANLFSTGANTKVANAFEDNDATIDTSIVLGARKKDSSLYGLPASGRTLFALRDGTTPSYAYNAKHKAMTIKVGQYSDDIAVSVRDNNNNLVVEEHDVFDHSTLKTYIAEVERIPASGVTATDMNLFINGTHEVDTQTTNIGNDIDLGQIVLGDNRFIMKGSMLFNKILSTDEKSLVHTRMSEDY